MNITKINTLSPCVLTKQVRYIDWNREVRDNPQMEGWEEAHFDKNVPWYRENLG